MFTKETKKTAEQIKGELLPIVAIISKLAKKTQQASEETRKAHQVATAWQYPNQKAYADEAGEDSQAIQDLRNTNAEKWSELLHEKYRTLNEKETAEKLARLNYHNYLLYFCDMVAYLLRVADNWAQFYEKKGIETLNEYLRNELQQRCYISRDGAGFDPFTSDDFYCYFNITVYGVCCISGNNWGTYRKHKADEENQPEKPNAPTVYTMAQYVKFVKTLSKLESEAKGKAKAHYELARQTGLIYFIGGLETPYAKVWKMRD